MQLKTSRSFPPPEPLARSAALSREDSIRPGLRGLKIKESVLVPWGYADKPDPDLVTYVNRTVQTLKRLEELFFTYRQTDAGVRVWRIERPAAELEALAAEERKK